MIVFIGVPLISNVLARPEFYHKGLSMPRYLHYRYPGFLDGNRAAPGASGPAGGPWLISPYTKAVQKNRQTSAANKKGKWYSAWGGIRSNLIGGGRALGFHMGCQHQK